MAYRSTRPRAKFFNMGRHAFVGRDAPQGVIQTVSEVSSSSTADVSPSIDPGQRRFLSDGRPAMPADPPCQTALQSQPSGRSSASPSGRGSRYLLRAAVPSGSSDFARPTDFLSTKNSTYPDPRSTLLTSGQCIRHSCRRSSNSSRYRLRDRRRNSPMSFLVTAISQPCRPLPCLSAMAPPPFVR